MLRALFVNRTLADALTRLLTLRFRALFDLQSIVDASEKNFPILDVLFSIRNGDPCCRASTQFWICGGNGQTCTWTSLIFCKAR